MTRHPAPAAMTPEAAGFSDRYARLQARLDVLRTAVADFKRGGASLESVRVSYRDLDRGLGGALTLALVADAMALPTPDGIKSWMGEGMARSLERELAMFAAMDLGAEVMVP